MPATAENLPITSADVLRPTAEMADYEPHAHPNIGRLRGLAKTITGQLEQIATAEWTPTFRPDLTEEDTRDFWLGYLQNVRHAHKQLLDGIAMKRFERDVKKHAPDLLAALVEARQGAIEQLRQIRAFHSVLLDENDAEELGIDVFPPAVDPETAPRGPSTSFEW